MRWSPKGEDDRNGLTQVLGALEAEIMECVWDLGATSVRDVHRCLLERRDIAYTTVMTVMSRLAEKGLLVRRQEGRAYIYTAAAARDEFCLDIMKGLVEGVAGRMERPALTHFVETLTEDDSAQLDLLAEIIAEKRREQGRA
jgi:predicted transcriptional regulator